MKLKIAQLLQNYRMMLCVSSNHVNCHTTV